MGLLITAESWMLKAVLSIRTIVSADLQVRPTAPGPHIGTQSVDHSCKDSHTPIPNCQPWRAHSRRRQSAPTSTPRRRRRAPTHSAQHRRRTSTALPARALFIYPGRFSSPQTAPAPWPYNSRYRECPRPRSSGGCTGADAFPYNLRLYGIKSALPGRQHERGFPLSNSPHCRGPAPHTPRQRFAAAPRPAPGAGPVPTPVRRLRRRQCHSSADATECKFAHRASQNHAPTRSDTKTPPTP